MTRIIVRNKDIDICLIPCHKMLSKLVDTGSGIKNDHFIVVAPDFDTGSITAILDGFFPRYRNRASYTPESKEQRLSPVLV